jgi:outer membrane protein TolC
MRWKIVVTGLVLAFAGALGCKQQCYLTECDYHDYHLRGMGSATMENDPTASLVPATCEVGKPTTVLNPERETRLLSLNEAIAMAMERGRIGSQIPVNFGITNDSLASFQGRTVAGSDNIRVLALDPAILGADIEASLAKFDARWTTSMTWNNTDRPVGTPLETFQAAGQVQAIREMDATFNTTLLKPLPTGGVAGLTFNTAYTFTNLQARVNPSYRPALVFNFEQPLLQGYGVEINQLRASHPGSIANPFPTGGRVEGVLITRLRFDQQRAEFERVVHYMIVNVEVAYWNLYGSYWNLYSREQALRQAYEAWKINKARYEAGRIPIQDYAQTRQQYELFRVQRIQALGQVLENERQLRILTGLPVEDGFRLVPADSPTLTPYQPDWSTALNDALALRPELMLARQDLKFRQLDVISQKNLLLPDLRFISSYDINAIGSRLDGPNSDNALRNLASDHFNNWSLGLRLDVPLGFRDAHSAVRVARLNLARSYYALRDQEDKTTQYLALTYRNLFQFYSTIEMERAQREAAATQLEARFKEFLAGRGTLDILLEAQRVWADALRDEYAAIVQYNNSLATFEFAKGTILQHDNVVITEGPLPQCAQVRAVEHERQRDKALILRTRPDPSLAAPCCFDKGEFGIPKLPAHEAPPMPALLGNQPPLPQITEEGPDTKSPGQPRQKADASAPAAQAVEPAGKFSTGTIVIEDAPPAAAGVPAASGQPQLGIPQTLPSSLWSREKKSGILPLSLPPSAGSSLP